MKTKFILVLITMLFISTFSFATAPTVADLTFSPEMVTNDLNYFTFPLDINAVATGDDLNADVLCFYKITTGSDAIEATWDSDSNTCMVEGLTSGAGDDWNFSMIVQSSTLDANGTSNEYVAWRDSTAPTVVGSYATNEVTITATDVATDTGDGAGVKSIFYSLDGDVWASVNDSTLTITDVDSAGAHSLDYYVIDNLDNNTEDANYDFVVVDSTSPTVGVTSISGYTQIGSNFYGTGTVVGGTVVEIDANEDSCEYTADGTNWVSADWATDHCEATSVVISGGTTYQFNTRISDNTGNTGTGTPYLVLGAMVVGDTGNVMFDFVGGVMQAIAENAPTLILIAILAVLVLLIVDVMTGAIGILEIIKRLK